MSFVFQIEEYVQEDGVIPYRDWFDSLDAQAAAKVATAKLRLSMGNTSRVKLLAEYKARKAALAPSGKGKK